MASTSNGVKVRRAIRPSPRTLQAQEYAARGFTVAEIATLMGITKQGAWKLLNTKKRGAK